MNIETLIILFFIYSFLGWLMEVILTIFKEKKFINRGFLIGPYCPIYGWGCILIILLLEKQSGDILSVFLKAILICSLLEYFTSYFMEKMFNARWWDYSDKKFNINGRICLETMLPFGLGALLIFYVLNPLFINIFSYANEIVLIVIASILTIGFIIDNVISFNITFKIKTSLIAIAEDSTEEINKRIKELLNSSKLIRRIKLAFPKFQAKIKYIEDKIRTIKL